MKRMIREMFGELSAWGRFWLALGLATLICAAGMSFAFGYEISIKHALFLMCLTAVAAFLPEAAYTQWETGRKGIAVVLTLLAVPTLVIEFYTHAGYTAGLRGTNIETATVQQAKWSGAQDGVAEDKASMALWKQQLATLLEQNAWAGTVKADGLKSELETLRARIEEEKKGKRGRKAGCGKECERLQDEYNALDKRIAIAEQATDLAKRIEATQRVLDGKRDTAAKTEFKSSAVAHQNEFLGRTVSLFAFGSLKPTEIMSEGAQQTVNLAMALAGTGLPALALFIAGLYRRESIKGDMPPTMQAYTSPLPPMPHEAQPTTHGHQTITQPIELNIPLTVNHEATQDHGPAYLPRRVIGHVRDTAFARRVEQATRSYRAQAA